MQYQQRDNWLVGYKRQWQRRSQRISGKEMPEHEIGEDDKQYGRVERVAGEYVDRQQSDRRQPQSDTDICNTHSSSTDRAVGEQYLIQVAVLEFVHESKHQEQE
jgi:hypothetical protein